MQKLLCGLTCVALALIGAGSASAQNSVKIGMINEYSGQFADTGAQIDHGVTLWMKQHGDTVAGKKIELIRKDTGGMFPDTAKRLAQEAIVRDHADILGGLLADAERPSGGGRFQASQEIHGGDECGDLDHYREIAIYCAHVVDHAAVELYARSVGR